MVRMHVVNLTDEGQEANLTAMVVFHLKSSEKLYPAHRIKSNSEIDLEGT